MDAETLRAEPERVVELIDHTNVEPDSTEAEVRELCEEVLEYGFNAACVVPYHAELAADVLGDEADVVVVVGFPYGIQNSQAKRAEVEALTQHADELDMVMNRTAFTNGDFEYVVNDIRAVKQAVGEHTLKCIIESPTLSDAEIRHASELVDEGGADFVKTAVGYEGGCDVDEVRAMREAAGPHVEVKASGGIHSFEEVVEMVEAGATRIGASSGVEIFESIQE
ncbi:deoxyribose-phosphate aldolase [Haloglomus salinum]|jgi:deoxyribose-phosphate aldolase|uniref:deoxyribose-phosphate aldolase n=1 Tax=Haloglomus salinum TaxID=2962673 RepID=UPI0020C9B2D8|nr:deoxyribose-phosphate aldolase [Haloglomus salinum]